MLPQDILNIANKRIRSFLYWSLSKTPLISLSCGKRKPLSVCLATLCDWSNLSQLAACLSPLHPDLLCQSFFLDCLPGQLPLFLRHTKDPLTFALTASPQVVNSPVTSDLIQPPWSPTLKSKTFFSRTSPHAFQILFYLFLPFWKSRSHVIALTDLKLTL